ncbi:MFS transporter [Planococcus koreensis]|uniref:MFS transporter n=1 Tax=Planococcus koreensis TaxID=112331 RepID=UPI0039FD7193
MPRTVLAPFAGYAADKYSKKTIVIVSQLASALAVGALLLYSASVGLSLPAIYTTTALLSVSSMFASVTFSASIANLIDPERIQKAIGFNQSALSIAAIGGPVVGGMLFGFVSMNVFLLIQIAGYLLALLLEATMNFKLFSAKVEAAADDKKSMMQSMKEGVAYLKTNRVIMVIVSTAIGLNFFFSALMIGLPFIAVQQMKVEAVHFGFIEAMVAVGMLLASIYFSLRKEVKYPLLFSKRALFAMSIILAGLALPLMLDMSYRANVLYFIVLMFAFGISNVFVNTPIGVMMQKDVEEEYRGRVFGILESMAMAMMPLGYLLFGLLYDSVPAEYVVLGSSLCLIGLVAYMIRPNIIREAYPELAAVLQKKPVH